MKPLKFSWLIVISVVALALVRWSATLSADGLTTFGFSAASIGLMMQPTSAVMFGEHSRKHAMGTIVSFVFAAVGLSAFPFYLLSINIQPMAFIAFGVWAFITSFFMSVLWDMRKNTW